jgi:ABC-type transport system involved in multi-copper enzyme maturation permease subunit
MATSSQQMVSLPGPVSAVELGKTNALSTIWRLTRMELYKLRRRRYSKVAVIILLALLVLAMLIISLYAFSQAQAPLSSFASPVCGQDTSAGTFTCHTPDYTQAQLSQMKQSVEQNFARMLGLPGSLTEIFQFLSAAAVLALLVLSPITGTEYTQGTVRLLFPRGPTRLQCMLAKVLASLIACAIILLLLSATYVLLGMLVYPLTGQPYSYTFGFFSSASSGSIGNTLLLGLIILAYWFAYAMLAFFFGTLGRATAAAIGGALGWYILEGILGTVFGLLQFFIPTGTLHDLFKAIPDYLLNNNFSALINNRLHAIDPTTALSSISDLHALLVIAVYLLLLIGGACLLARYRNITH